jgi:hypothetical protein
MFPSSYSWFLRKKQMLQLLPQMQSPASSAGLLGFHHY